LYYIRVWCKYHNWTRSFVILFRWVLISDQRQCVDINDLRLSTATAHAYILCKKMFLPSVARLDGIPRLVHFKIVSFVLHRDNWQLKTGNSIRPCLRVIFSRKKIIVRDIRTTIILSLNVGYEQSYYHTL